LFDVNQKRQQQPIYVVTWLCHLIGLWFVATAAAAAAPASAAAQIINELNIIIYLNLATIINQSCKMRVSHSFQLGIGWSWARLGFCCLWLQATVFGGCWHAPLIGQATV